MSASDFHYIEKAEIVAESQKALLIKWNAEPGSTRPKFREAWFPLTAIADHEDLKVGDKNVTVAVQKWIAKEKGLEVDDR